MKVIEQMLTGKLTMSEFAQILLKDKGVQEEIRRLVPAEAKNNQQHSFWDRISFATLEKFNFDYLAFLLSLSRFDGTLGDNLNIFSLIKIAYDYYRPELKYTTEYSEAHEVYLDAVSSYFEGPEVALLLNRLVMDALPVTPKSKRVKLLRDLLKESFHVVDNKRPYWIQGGEWPMGKNSPMQYVERRRISDGIRFIFRDIDTGEIRLVDQYY